jgi:SAM-dependent methyltransferase
MNNKALKAMELEEKRDNLAKQNKFKELKNLYRSGLAEIKDLNKPKFWDEILTHDKERGFAMYDDKINIVSGMLKDKKGILLDIGFGNGDLLKNIQNSNDIKLHGIEISKYALTKINKEIYGVFKSGFITKIPFKKNTFDYVIALDVLEHVPPSKIYGALGGVKRVMKKGGTFIISVPLNEGLPVMLEKGENPNGHVRIYTPELIKAELKIAGFKVESAEFLYAFRSFYTIKNLLRKYVLKNRWAPNLIIIKSKLY